MLAIRLITFLFLAIITPGITKYINGDTKIVGGENAKKGELPYQISLRSSKYGNLKEPKKSHFCGGTIYNEKYIVTAAHCFFDRYGRVIINKRNLVVVAGDYILSKPEESEQSRLASKIYINPDYSTKTSENDIAVIELRLPLNYTKDVQSLKMAEKDHTASGKALVSGWGDVKNKGREASDTLKKLTLNILTDESCRNDYSWRPDDIPDTAICAADPPNDSCQGDSGGPLVCNDTGSNYLCGVVSFGQDCGDKNYPGVYTEISAYIDYLTDIADKQTFFEDEDDDEDEDD